MKFAYWNMEVLLTHVLKPERGAGQLDRWHWAMVTTYRGFMAIRAVPRVLGGIFPN